MNNLKDKINDTTKKFIRLDPVADKILVAFCEMHKISVKKFKSDALSSFLLVLGKACSECPKIGKEFANKIGDIPVSHLASGQIMAEYIAKYINNSKK